MRSITDAYGLGTHTIYIQPYKVHTYCTIQSMNCVLQGRRQLHVEVGRLGSFRGYDISPFPPTGGEGPGLSGALPFGSLTMCIFYVVCIKTTYYHIYISYDI